MIIIQHMNRETAKLDFHLLVDSDELPSLAEEFSRNRRLRIRSALDPAVAAALHSELSGSDYWARTMRQGKTEREISPEMLASLDPKYLVAIEQFARQGDETTFRFLHDAIRIPADAAARSARGWSMDLFVDALNDADTLGLIRDLTGENVNRFYGDATRYLPGHFLTTHNDGRKFTTRVLAFVLYLSPRWHLDWGGVTLFHDDCGDIACGWTPCFNTVNLFSVPNYHSVSEVTSLAPMPRYAIAGWFCVD